MRLDLQRWKDLAALHARGQTRQLILRLSDLQEIARSSELTPSERLTATVVLGDVLILLLRKNEAKEILGPLAPISRESLPDHIGTSDPFVIGQLFSELGNLSYRFAEIRQGTTFAEAAAKEFDAVRDGGIALELARQENQIWSARLDWRQPRSSYPEVEHRLERATTALTALYADPVAMSDFGGRLDLLLAVALNLYAVIEWNRGNLDAARRRIYRSLYLLSAGRADDPVRLAYTLATAARIEGSHSTKQFAWGTHLADQAAKTFSDKELFGKYGHPFKSRAMIQAAQCTAKAGRFKDADDMLTRVDIDELDGDPLEQKFNVAEIALTKAWIAEGRKDWTAYREHATTLLGLYPVDPDKPGPRRVQAEGLLHAGRAAIYLAEDKKARDAGRALLLQAIAVARTDQRRKVEAVCSIAMCESYLADGNGSAARRHWDEARQLGVEGSSVYVAELVKRLAPAIQGCPTFLELDGQHAAAEQEFNLRYFAHHVEKAKRSARFLNKEANLEKIVRDNTGLSRNKYFEFKGALEANEAGGNVSGHARGPQKP